MLSATLRRGLGLCALVFLSCASTRVHAGPADVIYTPIVDWREWELELKGGVQDWNDPEQGERASKLALGYGVLPRWFVEVEAEYSQVPGAAARVEEFEWENIIQLTEHGRYWMDVGLFAELEHNRLEHKNEFKIGPMLQKEWGRSQANLNLLFARRLDAATDDGEDGADRATEFKYAAQWKYRLGTYLQPGVQAFGSLGDFGDLHSEQLRLGPAVFGTASLGNGRKLAYNAAVLAGLTPDTPDTTVRFQLEYEFF